MLFFCNSDSHSNSAAPCAGVVRAFEPDQETASEPCASQLPFSYALVCVFFFVETVNANRLMPNKASPYWAP